MRKGNDLGYRAHLLPYPEEPATSTAHLVPTPSSSSSSSGSPPRAVAGSSSPGIRITGSHSPSSAPAPAAAASATTSNTRHQYHRAAIATCVPHQSPLESSGGRRKGAGM
nr:unnamed protein product [Digitaria exilis]